MRCILIIYYICDELYQYALTLNSNTGIPSNCASPVGISAIEDEEGINIYPNPSLNGKFIIELEKDYLDTSFKIRNIYGVVVHQGTLLQKETEILLEDVSSGIYFVDLISSNSRITKKIILQ